MIIKHTYTSGALHVRETLSESRFKIYFFIWVIFKVWSAYIEEHVRSLNHSTVLLVNAGQVYC